MSGRALGMAIVAAACLAATAFAAAAQQRTGSTGPADSGGSVPNALQGFQQNRGQPVQIEAARLEVRDKQKIATFTGNVKVVQGDTIMRCKTLVVYYEPKPEDAQSSAQSAQASATGMRAAQPGPGGSQQISRLEAKGNVIVTQKDQTATGDTGLFDMRANTVTLISNVVVSQGQNVLRGERLVVDLTTGVSRVDAGSSSGPVRMLIQQGSPQPAASGTSQPPPRFGPQRSSN